MKIKDSGHRREYTTGAVRDRQEGKGRMDLLPPTALLELAKHFEEGAKKYGDRNWEKGIPMSDFMDSALRHWCAYMNGETDEPHLRALAWNVMCALATAVDRPEMQDIPAWCTKVETPEVCVPQESVTLYNVPGYRMCICDKCLGYVQYLNFEDVTDLYCCPSCNAKIDSVQRGGISDERAKQLVEERAKAAEEGKRTWSSASYGGPDAYWDKRSIGSNPPRAISVEQK